MVSLSARAATFLAALIVVVVFSSCGAQQQVVLRPDGSGIVDFTYTVSPVILESLDDFAAFLPGDDPLAEGEVFDLEEIRSDFSANPAVTLLSVGLPQPNTLSGSFQFTDVEEVFTEEEELRQAGIVQLESSGDRYTLLVRLNRENFANITTLFPALENPLMDMFGPSANAGVSESEYLEMMEFAFDSAVVPAIRESYVEARILVDGAVIDQQGGIIVGDEVIFQIPLIRVLLLDERLEYSLTFEQ